MTEVYKVRGALHPDHEERLSEKVLHGSDYWNKFSQRAFLKARIIGWEGHTRVGPFIEGDVLIWDIGDNTVYIATDIPDEPAVDAVCRRNGLTR